MTPPIRRGDGTPLAPSGIAQVRAGDGDVYYERNVIPDSVVDNFEAADAEGPYGSGATIADYYSGDTGAFERASASYEGSFALESTGPVYDNIRSVPGDGLPRYPDPDNSEIIEAIINDVAGSLRPMVLFNVEDAASPGGYGVSFNAGNQLGLWRYDDLTDPGNSETEINRTSGIGGSADTLYWLVIDPPTSSDGSLSATVYNLNTGDLSRGSEVASVSGTDGTYGGERGMGWTKRANGNGIMADLHRIV